MSVYDLPIKKVEEELQTLRVAYKAANSMVDKAHIVDIANERTKWLEKLKHARARIEVYK